MYTESMLLTRVFQCESENGDRMLALFSSFPRAAGLALPNAMLYAGLEVRVSSWVCVSECKAVKDADLPEADD